MKIDFKKICNKVQNFSKPKLCTKKKFELKRIDSKVFPYELYFTNSHHYIDQNVLRKFYNHLKVQGLTGTIKSVVHRKYNHNKFYTVQGKGLFVLSIRNYRMDQPDFAFEITRNTIVLGTDKQIFDLHDKSERFAASMYFSFDYDELVNMQIALKHRPSGFYHLYVE